jgi:PBP1b-binding outer membrane lipoprotein LpoB
MVMRIRRCFVIAVISGIAVVLWGCASNQQSAASANSNPAATTYSNDDLQRTGKRTPGEALQAADPSVTAVGGH